ncbi:hypothetical protein B0H14DRAFT_2956710 [Mycena olivaceomarginata]|nr:hypothetical protein B0H14DRAFT_2956710 [Mycena olivaceomarginata]
MLDGAVIDKAPLAFVSQWVEIQKQQVDLLVQKAILLALRDLLSKAYMPPRTPRRPRIRLRILGASKHRRSARGLRQAPRGRRPMQPGTRMLDESQSQSSALPDTVASLCLAVQDLRIAQAQQYLASKGWLTTSTFIAMMRLSVPPPHVPL